jgi:hypothetical protein
MPVFVFFVVIEAAHLASNLGKKSTARPIGIESRKEWRHLERFKGTGATVLGATSL